MTRRVELSDSDWGYSKDELREVRLRRIAETGRKAQQVLDDAATLRPSKQLPDLDGMRTRIASRIADAQACLNDARAAAADDDGEGVDKYRRQAESWIGMALEECQKALSQMQATRSTEAKKSAGIRLSEEEQAARLKAKADNINKKLTRERVKKAMASALKADPRLAFGTFMLNWHTSPIDGLILKTDADLSKPWKQLKDANCTIVDDSLERVDVSTGADGPDEHLKARYATIANWYSGPKAKHS